MVTTRVGGMSTLLIAVVVLIYAALKFTHLTSRYNPQMSSYLKDVEEDETLNLSDEPDF